MAGKLQKENRHQWLVLRLSGTEGIALKVRSKYKGEDEKN
jgi:hypothetical protein